MKPIHLMFSTATLVHGETCELVSCDVLTASNPSIQTTNSTAALDEATIDTDTCSTILENWNQQNCSEDCENQYCIDLSQQYISNQCCSCTKIKSQWDSNNCAETCSTSQTCAVYSTQYHSQDCCNSNNPTVPKDTFKTLAPTTAAPTAMITFQQAVDPNAPTTSEPTRAPVVPTNVPTPAPTAAVCEYGAFANLVGNYFYPGTTYPSFGTGTPHGACIEYCRLGANNTMDNTDIADGLYVLNTDSQAFQYVPSTRCSCRGPNCVAADFTGSQIINGWKLHKKTHPVAAWVPDYRHGTPQQFWRYQVIGDPW